MSPREELFARVCRDVLVGVVREQTAESASEVAAAYVDGGIRTLEITLTTPGAIELLARCEEQFRSRDILLAAGSIRGGNDAAQARRAGARVLVSPHTDLRVIEYGLEHDMLVIAGAATPTEIVRAWEAGAHLIKVYPAPHLGGPDYIRTLRQPLPDIPLLAGGPVALDMIEPYLEAGCRAINLGGALAEPRLVSACAWDEIRKRAELAVSIVRGTRLAATVH